jgi:hypothetical protein
VIVRPLDHNIADVDHRHCLKPVAVALDVMPAGRAALPVGELLHDAARAAAGPSFLTSPVARLGRATIERHAEDATCAVTLAGSPAAGTPKNVRAPATTTSRVLTHPMLTRTNVGESLSANPALGE